MQLTSPTGRARGGDRSTGRAERAPTTEPGFRNANGQVVIRRTGAPSPLRDRQVIYELRCGCGHRYGCNGMDVKGRKCPQCDGGAPGEPLHATEPTLF